MVILTTLHLVLCVPLLPSAARADLRADSHDDEVRNNNGPELRGLYILKSAVYSNHLILFKKLRTRSRASRGRHARRIKQSITVGSFKRET